MTRHRWLLIVAIAFGLVGMHHLVHAHPDHPTPVAMASTSHTGHAHPDPAEAKSPPASLAGPQANCCDPMDMVGHFCLAVLTAVTALAASLIFATARRRFLYSRYLPAIVSAVAARAPPIGRVRLNQLCVSRR